MKRKLVKIVFYRKTRPHLRTKHRETVTRIRTTVEYGQLERIYKTTALYGPTNPNNHTNPISSGGEEMWNAEIKLPYYITVTLDRELFRSLFTKNSNCFCLIYVLNTLYTICLIYYTIERLIKYLFLLHCFN